MSQKHATYCGLSAGTQKMQILVCGGTGCKASASHDIAANLREALRNRQQETAVEVITTGCFSFCEKGPIVKIIPDNTFYVRVKPKNAEEIVDEHIINSRKVEHLLYKNPETGEPVCDSKHMDFYKKQMRIALRNCGFIDPENIEEYIARDGYEALTRCLTDKQPAEIISERNYCTPERAPCMMKTGTKRSGKHTKTPIFKNCMKSI